MVSCGDNDGDGDGDGSGRTLKGLSLVRENSQRNRSRSTTSKKGCRQWTRRKSGRAVVWPDDDLENGRADSGGCSLKDAEEFGGGSSRAESGSSTVRLAAGTRAAARGMEPAVKGCRVMTTATFLKLVRCLASVHPRGPPYGAGRSCVRAAVYLRLGTCV